MLRIVEPQGFSNCRHLFYTHRFDNGNEVGFSLALSLIEDPNEVIETLRKFADYIEESMKRMKESQ